MVDAAVTEEKSLQSIAENAHAWLFAPASDDAMHLNWQIREGEYRLKMPLAQREEAHHPGE